MKTEDLTQTVSTCIVDTVSKCTCYVSPHFTPVLWLLWNDPRCVVQYTSYEAVVVEHRAMKEKQRLKEEQERRENQISTKVRFISRLKRVFPPRTNFSNF